ncbi:MAG: TonB-dependent receptor [Opitutaceae bacterium]|nr:TonB-dependent receptor [Cytophagales bacterium]
MPRSGLSFFFISFFVTTFNLFGQNIMLKGRVLKTVDQSPISSAKVHLKHLHTHLKSDKDGSFEIEVTKPGEYQIVIYKEDFKVIIQQLVLNNDTSIEFKMDSLQYELSEVQIQAQGSGVSDMEKLKTVEGTAIYEGKKNEVIVMKEMTANLATNNARQVFAKVPGLNIWESDCAGLQLDIGARGLSPNRTSNFNVRQNGYDISADALGYPESYYTPPLEAIERIEIVRGAASLQYGTQFGGLLNFKMKQGADKPVEVTTRQTLGSFKFLNSFNSIGGKKGKFRYYGFYQHKQGDCWRPYSSFNLNMGYGSIAYNATDKLTITADITVMNYLTQMPGGLKDSDFKKDPHMVLRKRNWFQVKWNLFSVYADYKITPRTTLNTRFFGVSSSREALGNLDRLTRLDDPKSNRNLLSDKYLNFGNETRLLHRYTIGKQAQVFVLGFRVYKGNTIRKQGDANNGDGPDFAYLNPNSLENSDYTFPGTNYAAFGEHVFYLNKKLSVTPGARIEFIETNAKGYYNTRIYNGAGTILLDENIAETRSRSRHFVLLGIGMAYKHKEWLEAYANISQNYRAITFSDIRVVNPNFVVDPEIKDEKGYTADIGARGTFKRIIQYDFSFFYMQYSGRIGELLKSGKAPTFLDYRYRTNIADSRTYGLEAFAEIDALKLVYKNSKVGIPVYTSISLNDARYIHSDNKAIQNKLVELVPGILLRMGSGLKWKDFRINYQFSYVSQQYTDASNSISDPTAVVGIIPEYYIMDLSAKYTFKFLSLETGLNNLSDNVYFTRRAEGYPGPGILPSPGRNWYVTLGFRF